MLKELFDRDMLAALLARTVVYLCVVSALVSCGGQNEQSTASAARTLAATTTSMANDIVVSGLEKVHEKRISRTVYEYAFRVALTNNGTMARTIVVADLQSVGTGTAIVDGSVQISNIPAGASVLSSKFVVVRHDRMLPFDFNKWVWKIESLAGSSTEKNLTLADPVVALDKIISVDFSPRAELLGSKVTVQALVDPSIDEAMESSMLALGIAATDPLSLKIGTMTPVQGDVTASINVSTLLTSLTPNQGLVVYAYISGDEDDGENTVMPLLTNVDLDRKSAQVTIPREYFLQSNSGYTAGLKVGVANLVLDPSTQTLSALSGNFSAAMSATRSSEAGISLPCPLPSLTCVETSRFNSLRKINGPRSPHLGVDFRARTPTAIVLPSNGRVIHAYTKKQHDAAVAQILEGPPVVTACPVEKCKLINKRAGISLTVDYVAFKIKIMHLSSISASLLNSNGTFKVGATTSESMPVAMTGSTGAALQSPHLHYILYRPMPLTCIAFRCKFVMAPVDPFPAIVNDLKLRETSGATVLKTDANYRFRVEATDYRNIAISSDVGNAKEWPASGIMTPSTPYDPTRKVCFASSPATIIFNQADDALSWIGQPVNADGKSSHCVPWNTTISGRATDSKPDTTVKMRFSRIAEVLEDPLSERSATLQLKKSPDTAYTGNFFATGPLNYGPGQCFGSFSGTIFVFEGGSSLSNNAYRYAIIRAGALESSSCGTGYTFLHSEVRFDDPTPLSNTFSATARGDFGDAFGINLVRSGGQYTGIVSRSFPNGGGSVSGQVTFSK